MKLSRKNVGRVATTFLATAMLASLTAVPAMAEDVTVTFTKTIDMTNAPGATVPDVTYEYDVAPGTAVPANSASNTPEIKAGDANDFTISSVEFTAADAIPDDKKVDKKATLTFAEGAYTAPGIYRYEVTEIPDAQIADLDFNDDFTYTVDIYVAYNADDELEVQNAVWMRDPSTPVINGDEAVYGDGTTDEETSTKIGGDEDAYTTYSLTIEKQVEGDMADAGREYEFDVTLSGLMAGTQVTVDGTQYETAATVDGSLTIADSISIKPTESVTITGLPSSTMYQIVENLAASEGYTVTATVNETNPVSVTKDGDNAYRLDTVSLKTSNSDATVSDKVVVTNARDAVSPTGIVMNVAPYALLVVIAAAGCFVFLRKRDED